MSLIDSVGVIRKWWSHRLNCRWNCLAMVKGIAGDKSISFLGNKARFQQKQLAAKEQKMQELNDGTVVRVPGGRGSAGSGSSGGSGASMSSTLTAGKFINARLTLGRCDSKVRQMFNERRHNVTGIDKSYPLQPIKSRPSPTNQNNNTKPTTQKTTSTRTYRASRHR